MKQKTETSEMARRVLTMVGKVLHQDHKLKAEMSNHGKTPVLETDKGNVIFFMQSGDYRLHHKCGTRHTTFTSPMELIDYFTGNVK